MIEQITLTAANDNPGGATRIDTALTGLVTLLARADAARAMEMRAANTNAAPNATTRDARQ